MNEVSESYKASVHREHNEMAKKLQQRFHLLERAPTMQRLPLRSITVDTMEFEFSHGKLPRGRGSWLFNFGSGDEWIRNAAGSSSLLYGEARAIAVRIAAARGVDYVKVCP